MTLGKVHVTEHYNRYRQESPKHFAEFRIKQVSPGTKVILGRVKHTKTWRIQSVLKKR